LWVRARVLTLLAVAAVAMLFAAGSAHAQTEPTVRDTGIINKFPDGMAFGVRAESASEITDIRLRYEILPDGTSASARPDFDPAASVDATVELGGADLYLPPGTIIEYHWEVTDEDGATAQTDQVSFFYDDVRFEWRKLEEDNLAIYHYTGDDNDAQNLHDVGVQALADGSALLETEVPFKVNVWIYDSVEDMRPALPRTSPTFESQIITAGIRISSDTVLVLGSVSYDTLRHELTHIVTALAGDSALGSVPSWLDEGTAVYGQEDPGGFADAIERAIDRGNVLSVREISAYPGDPDKVELFYGEGWSLVTFLIDTYGQPKFAQLYADIKSGKTLDEALTDNYGFDQDGLENAWREANDLPPRETPEPTQAPQITAAPSQTEKDDGGTSTGTLVAIAAGIIVLALVVGAGGIMVARRVG
jgi:hypothetical protein